MLPCSGAHLRELVGFLCLVLQVQPACFLAGRAANKTPRKGEYAHRLYAAFGLPALRPCIRTGGISSRGRKHRMATQQEVSSTGEPMFHMPESAYERLLVIRDQLRLIATLVQPYTRAEEQTPREVPLAPLAQGLALVAGHITDVLEAVE